MTENYGNDMCHFNELDEFNNDVGAGCSYLLVAKMLTAARHCCYKYKHVLALHLY
jgi:hypothetical protein